MVDRLPRSFFTRDAEVVARALLGQRLVRIADDGQRRAGTIVEVEAYLGEPDRAAHTFGGRRTARNETMWWQGGHLYVYFTYGMHYCANVVCSQADHPVAVLLRAIEPTEGLDAMRAARGPAAKRDTDLCSGPAKLCEALGIDRALNGEDLVESDAIFIERLRQRAMPRSRIAAAPRIGVAYAGEWAEKPLRFCVKDSVYLSRSRRVR